MNRPLNRRGSFPILSAGVACAACPAGAQAAAVQQPAPAPQAGGVPWVAKADLTWEQLFRFTYQKGFVPVMKALAAKLGEERFAGLLRETVCEVAAEKMKRAPIPQRDFAAFRANMRQIPPIYRAALEYEVVQDNEQALEYRVKSCLSAKVFRESGAGNIGSACVCAADFAIARVSNPKLKLEREKPLMEGQDCCHLRYTMEG